MGAGAAVHDPIGHGKSGSTVSRLIWIKGQEQEEQGDSDVSPALAWRGEINS